MKHYYRVIAMFSLVLMAGCAEEPEESNSEYVQRLREKAIIVGRNELARFNAADLLYKNIPELHSIEVPIINRINYVWAKTYRRFTDFDVIDVTRSTSLLSPISYSITFRYDQFSTLERITEMENAKEVAMEDTSFKLRFSDSFTRYYLCNEEGNLVDQTPPLPNRPDYFQKNYNGEAKLGLPPR